MNNVSIIGRLARDPEFKTVKGDTEVVEMRIAVPGRGRDTEPDWFDVTVFGPTAVFAVEHLTQGQRIGISGRLKSDVWTDKDDNRRSRTYIVGENIDPLDRPKAATSEPPAASSDNEPAAEEAKPKRRSRAT